MTNIFLPFNGQAETLAQTLFVNSSGISLVGGSVTYTGNNDAVSTFDNVVFGQSLIPTAGILLTSGDGTPPLTNTQGGYTVFHGTAGDADLDAIVQGAFPGAGNTEDASALKFQVKADPGIKTIVFDIIFGSDEFPEFSNTSFVDIAAVTVNGKNATLFGGDPSRPLSILDKNLGYFQDNQSGAIPIEYDGISNKLTVIAKVKEGVNDIKIAVADTGDSILDFGIFVANIRGSTQDFSGILNEIVGTDGNDKLKALKDIDNILFGDLGADKLSANTGYDVFQGDVESGAGTTGKTASNVSALDEVSAGEIFKDTFIFKKAKFLDKAIDKTDVVADFDKKDKINVSDMVGPKFDFIGKDRFGDNGDPEIWYKQVKNQDYTAVYFDTDGNGKSDASLKLLGLHKLNDNDFVV